MLFNKVTKEHILKAIKDLDSKSYPSGFRPSTTYDVLYNGKTYPPPAIMAYVNSVIDEYNAKWLMHTFMQKVKT